MKKTDLFPRRYMSGSDLGGKPWSFKVSHVKMEEMHDKTTDTRVKKGVVYFTGPKKGLILTPTIFDQIVDATGGKDDTDNWAGHTVTLYPTMTRAFGQDYLVVRVRKAENGASEPPAEMVHDEDELVDGLEGVEE